MLRALRFLFATLLSAGALAGYAGTQLIVPTPTSTSLTPGSSLAVQVAYNTTGPADNTLSGISFRMHWDSRRLTFNNLSGLLTTRLIARTDPQSDDENFDGDASTDTYILVEWNDEAGAWPGGTLPTSLFTANFTTTGSFSTGSTAIRFSSRVTALDYDFASSPVVVTGVPGADTVPPTISLVGGNVTLIQNQKFTDPGAFASDNRDGVISNRIVVSGAVNTKVPGTYTLSYDVTDLAGNAATTVTRTVQVLPPDVTPPSVTPPADLTLEATGPSGIAATAAAAFLASGSALDDRYGIRPVTTGIDTDDDGVPDSPVPDTLPLGTTQVYFSATDLEGNTGRATALILVQDTTAPVFSGAADVVVEAESGAGTPITHPLIDAALNAVSAFDTVSGTIPKGDVAGGIVHDAPAVFPIGTTLVTFTGADAAGNQASTTLNVTVVDTSAPSILVGDDITVEAVDANGTPKTDTTITAFLAGATASDAVDPSVVITNDAPDVFPVGTTPVTFTVQDVSGNLATVTRFVTVVDTTAPTVTPPNGITVVETGGGQISSGASILQSFLNGATASDAVDPAPVITNDVPSVLPVGTTTVTFTATDSAGNAGTATADITVLAAAGGDQDSDGMPDSFEAQYGLDPNSGADAAGDPDQDGFTNLQEFQNGTDPNVDSTIPVVTPPADITVNAIGPLTPVALGTATATDAKDGTLPVTLVAPRNSPFPPGRYVLEYRATDPAGNVGTAQQIVNVVPLIELSPPQRVSEGQSVVVDVLLNGDAPSYPVTVPFTVSGTATGGSDHDLVDGTVTIESGRRGQIVFNTIADGAPETSETVVLTLGTPTNAVAGANTATTVTILAQNVAPVVDIQLLQGDSLGQRVLRSGGNVTATALVSDGNVGDTFTYDWSGSDPAIPSTNGTTSATYVFNPNVTPGLYRLRVRVTDNGGASSTQTLLVEVLESAPTLSNSVDTDGDGVVDAIEGADDSDGDGVPDYLDPINGGSLLPATGSGSSFLLETEQGLSLAQGQTAFASDAPGALISLTDITNHGGATGGTTAASDTAFAYDLPFYDFVIEGAAIGDSVSVVIPLSAALPAGTLVYRKYSPTTGFSSFVVDANNAVRSAPGQLGVCPAVGSGAYTTGLTAGHFCVQLTIQDGGPNDADAAANGRIVDPGAVGRQLPVTPPPPSSGGGGGGGGGCAVGDGPADPTLPVLMLAALGYLLRRRAAGAG